GEPLAGELERGAGARRRLVEEVDHRLAAQGRHLADAPQRDAEERLGRVEQRSDGGAVEPLDPQEVPVRVERSGAHDGGPPAGSPSGSASAGGVGGGWLAPVEGTTMAQRSPSRSTTSTRRAASISTVRTT